MLIFWKLVYGEDVPLYSKDYSRNNVSLLNTTYSPTQRDRAINLAMGSFFLIAFAVSTTMNYIVYNFNNRKQTNLTNFLFKSLSIVDFMTTIYAPWLYASLMFSTKAVPCSNQMAIITRQLVCILGCISQVITWMLAVTRFVRVILPFTLSNKRLILGYVFLYGALMTVNSTISLAIQTGNHDKSIITMWVMRGIVHLCFLLNLAHCTTGIICSVSTSIYLVRCTKVHTVTAEGTFHQDQVNKALLTKQRLRGCVTILLMNIPYLVNISFIIYVTVHPGRMSFHDVLFGFLPIITSTVNPVIVVTRNLSKIKLQILSKNTKVPKTRRSLGFMTDMSRSLAINSPDRRLGSSSSDGVSSKIGKAGVFPQSVVWNTYNDRKHSSNKDYKRNNSYE